MKIDFNFKHALAAVAVAVVGFHSHPLCHADNLSIVLRGNDPAAALSYEGVPLQMGSLRDNSGTLSVPSISESGDILLLGWAANLPPEAIDNKKLLIKIRPNGTKEVMARSGVPLNVSGVSSPLIASGFLTPSLSVNGDVAFSAKLAGSGITSANDLAALMKTSGSASFRMLAREGDLIPGSTSSIASFDPPIIAPESTSRFFSTNVAVSASIRAILQIHPLGGAEMVVRSGESFQGLGPTISSSLIHRSNDHGDLVFTTTLQGTGITTANNVALWSYKDGIRRMLLRTSDPVPTGVMSNPSVFSFIHNTNNGSSSAPLINNNGKIIFLANTASSQTGVVNGGGLFMINADGTDLKAVSIVGSRVEMGDPAAGCLVSPLATTSPSFFLNEDNSVIFYATLPDCLGYTRSGLMVAREAPGGLYSVRTIFYGGQQAPGVDVGVAMVLNPDFEGVPPTYFSKNGGFAVWVKLLGNNLPADTDKALFRYSNNELRMIARKNVTQLGSLVDVNGITQTYTLLPLGNFGPSCAINGSGQLLCLSGTLESPSGATSQAGLWTINTAGRVNLIGVNVQPLRLSDGSAPVSGSFSVDFKRGINERGDYTFSTQLLTASTSDVLLQGAVSEVTTSCQGDFNRDGNVTVEDLFGFLDLFFSQNLEADLDRDGVISINDIFVFLDHFLIGC